MRKGRGEDESWKFCSRVRKTYFVKRLLTILVSLFLVSSLFYVFYVYFVFVLYLNFISIKIAVTNYLILGSCKRSSRA